VTGKGNYTGTVVAPFTIASAAPTDSDIAGASVTLAKTSYAYDGKAKKPGVTIKLGAKTLVKDRDFTVKYDSRKIIGASIVTITGKGDYKGMKTASFKIAPKQVKIKKVMAGRELLKVTWNKADAKQKITGYQIHYRSKGNAGWSKPKSVSSKKLSYTIKSLKKGKTYQIQVRAYKKISGVNYYGNWSKTKTGRKVK
jgi:hypothetical protein